MNALFRTTLSLLVLAGGLAAGRAAVAAFPDPYCVRDYSGGVEPITLVRIDGINNVTSAAPGGVADEDFTAIVGQLAPGGEYQIAVQGNNNGPHVGAIAAYFDWNGDGVFDADEGYLVGKLVGSTGVDGQTTSMVIHVPAGATPGPTRMRITKQFTLAATPGIADAPACGSTGSGQAEDYTVILDALAPVPPTLALAINPRGAQVGARVGLGMTLGNTSRGSSALTADFTTTLPAGLGLFAATTTCDGTLVAVDGTRVLTLEAGGAIPPGGCTISTQLVADSGGVFNVATGPLATEQGDAPAALAVFIATEGGPSVTYATGFESPFAVGALNGQQGWSARAFDVATIMPANGTQHVRATSLAAPTSADQPLASTPHFDAADTRYATISANLRLSRTGAGASWRLKPQDPDAGLVTTIVQFDRALARDIQVIDYSTGTLVNTGAQWPVDTYFNFKVIVDRISGALDLCIDGASIYSDPSGAGTAGHNIKSAAISQSPGAGQSAGNTLDADDLRVEYTPYGQCDGVPASFEVTASVGAGAGSISPSGTQTLAEGATPAFTLSPAPGQQLAGVGGTCGGYLVGQLFTTYPLAGDCTVIANFVATDPVASVAPAAIDLTAEEGRLAYAPLTIANAGAGTLDWAIAESAARKRDHAPPSFRNNPAARMAPGALMAVSELGNGRGTGGNASGAALIAGPLVIAQMADNTPGPQGVACNAQDGSAIRDNSWWRRFDLDTYPALSGRSSVDIDSVTVAAGGMHFPGGLPATINLYTTPHAVAPASIDTAQLTLVGSASLSISTAWTPITVPVSGHIDDLARTDLVVEFHTDGAPGGTWYPGANATPQSGPTFLSSSACGIARPTRAADLGFADFHLGMLVNLDEGKAVREAPCDNPGDIPWLGASPVSGALPGGASDTVMVTGDATQLLPGSYAANLCITSNDPLQPLIRVPVTLTVNPSDGIFCNGFDADGNGHCAAVPLLPDIVTSGPLNHPIADDLHGTSVNWITGAIQDGYVANDHFNPYDNNQQLTFWWNTGAPDIAGVSSSTTTSDFLVLPAGAVVGPASAWSTQNNPGPAAWAAGATGYLGFRFNCAALPTPPASGLCYGYVHLQTTAPTGFPATILDYAYDQSGNPITVP